MSAVAVILETDGGAVSPDSLGILAAAASGVGRRVLAIVFDGRGDDHRKICGAHGADVVVDIGRQGVEGPCAPDSIAAAVAEAVQHFGAAVVAGHSSPSGNDLLARTAAILGGPLVLNCESADLTQGRADKLCLGGHACARYRLTGAVRLFGLLPQSVPPPSRPRAAVVETFDAFTAGVGRLTVARFDPVGSDRPALTAARIVVAGGRGVGSKDNFRLLVDCADRLGAAVAASRAAVEAGYAPYEWQVGLTGKKISPELYIACGISGAFQHLAGILSAGTIIAVNHDNNAPLFRHCDYGLVGDLFEALPALVDALQAVGIVGGDLAGASTRKSEPQNRRM